MNNKALKNSLDKALQLFQQGKYTFAKQELMHLNDSNPGIALAWFLLGAIYAQEKDHQASITCLQKSVELQPIYPDAYNNMGVIYEALNKLEDAKHAYQTALQQKPGYPQALNNLGNIAKNENKLNDALEYYHQAIKGDPSYANALNNLALAYMSKRQFTDAEKYLKRALVSQPDDPVMLNNLGQVYYNQFLYDTALEYFQKTLVIAPGFSSAFLNIGLLLESTGDYNAAKQYFLQAAKDPEFKNKAYNNISQLELTLQHFSEGWEYYRYRPGVRDQINQLPESLPLDLSDTKLLIVKDQGLGDEIFFCRFLKQLQAQGAEVTYYTDNRLLPILARSLKGVKVTNNLPPYNKFDGTLPVSELPRLLWKNMLTPFPAAIQLSTDNQAITSVKNILPNNTLKNIAITWEAGLIGSDTLFKRIDPYQLGSMLKSLNANIIIIQRNPRARDIKALESGLNRKAFNYSFLNDNLDEMLAFLAVVDEYVAVSNTNVHLMAGLNKNAQIMVPHPTEWRWTLDASSPWFPQFLLYRQDLTGSWQNALKDCKSTLEHSVTN